MVPKHTLSFSLYLFLYVILLPAGLTFAGSLISSSKGLKTPSDGTSRLKLAPLNPDFVAWRTRRQAVRIASLAGGTPQGIAPSPVGDSHLCRGGPSSAIRVATPTRYDLRSYG